MDILILFKNLFFENIIWQTIWLIAFIVWVIAFLHKKDKYLYMWLMIAQFFWIIHFFLMWLYVWAFVNIIWFIRSFIALKYKHIKEFIPIFILIYIFIGFLSYNNIFDILPLLAWFFGTLAFLYFSWIKWRFVLLICSFLWLNYNIIWNSIWWIITEIFMIIAGLISIYRLIKYKKN